MSSAAIDTSATERFATLAREALRTIGPMHVRTAILLGLGVTAWNWIAYSGEFLIAMQTMPLSHVLEPLIGDQIRALWLMIAIVIADRIVDDGAPRRRTYVLAALAGCLAGFMASEPFHWVWRTYVQPNAWPQRWWWTMGTTGNVFWPALHFLLWLPAGSAFVFLYAHWRSARRTAHLLSAAELDRIRRSRMALETRLQAMQARVEPQFLFNTLAQVARLYQSDASLAGRTLDDLIAYLRAAMPAMRGTSSTVAQEVELARAYLDIVRMRLSDRLRVSIDIPPDVGDARMPPMMLLPLIDHTVVRGLGPASEGGAVRIAAQVVAGRLRMTIVDSGAAIVPDMDADGIASIRQRLEALYGGDATLDVHRAGERATEAVLDLPLQAGERIDDATDAPGTADPARVAAARPDVR
jgi:hypothetical protein